MACPVPAALLLAYAIVMSWAEQCIDEDSRTCAGHAIGEVGEALLQLRSERKAAIQTVDAPSELPPGGKEPLTKQGFEEVQSLCCILAMEGWTRRKIDEMGLEVCFEGGLSGLMPWFSCNPSMTYEKAVAKLTQESQWQCPWLRKKGFCPKDDWPADCPSAPENPSWHRRRVCSPASAVVTTTLAPTTTTPAPLPCCKPKSSLLQAQSAVHSNATRSVTSAITAFDCDAHPGPLVVMRPRGATNSHSGFDMAELNLATGKYQLIYHMPADWTSPKFFQVCAAAINPIDGIIYGIVCMTDPHPDNYCYVSRIDASGFEFLALAAERTLGSGTMTSKGKYYFNGWSKPMKIYVMDEIHNWKGHADRKKAPALKGELITLSGVDAYIKGLVSYSGTIGGTGTGDYLITFVAPSWASKLYPEQMVLVKDDGANSKYWVMQINPTAEKGAYTSFLIGWNFQGKVYFASGNNLVQDGNDVFEVPVDSLTLKEGGVLLKKVFTIQENNLAWIDGFNCPSSASPFPSQDKGCGDAYDEVEALNNGTCPWGTFQTWH